MSNLSYSTIGGYRTAISPFHDLIEGKRISDFPVINRIIRGVFQLRTPRTKILPFWNVEVVLAGIQKPPFEPLAQVSLKWITLKTAVLLAMVTACRSSDLKNCHVFIHV